MIMGFKGMITEGAKHVLGWKSPGYVQVYASNTKKAMSSFLCVTKVLKTFDQTFL